VNAEQLQSELRTLDIQLTVDGDGLRCSAPEGRLTRDLEQRIQLAKAELLRALRASSGAAAIPRRAVGNATLPLSFEAKLQSLRLDAETVEAAQKADGGGGRNAVHGAPGGVSGVAAPLCETADGGHSLEVTDACLCRTIES
jgi:hypothetical protein